MKPSRSAAARQQRRLFIHVESADADGFSNVLTSPLLLADDEALLAEHRERGGAGLAAAGLPYTVWEPPRER